jgi:DNA-binding PadR family transcriptional regulator
MTLRHTILGVLDWIPMHGYALREMTRGYSWIHPMANVNLYPTLRELEIEGLVEHVEEVHDGRLRKVYSTTQAGKAELHRWLTDASHPPGNHRDPVLLKLCLLRPETLAGAEPWVAAELERRLGVLEEADRFLEDNRGRIPRYSLLVAEHGRDLLRLRVDLLRRVLEAMRGERV